MTSTLRAIRIVAVAAMAALSPTAAAPQTAAQPPGPQYGGRAPMMGVQEDAAGPDVMGQLAILDARIKALVTEMRTVSGEQKVDTMAALLTAMVERQALMEREMRTMRESMMRDGMMREEMMHRMMGRSGAPAVSVEEEPGGMCAPSN